MLTLGCEGGVGSLYSLWRIWEIGASLFVLCFARCSLELWFEIGVGLYTPYAVWRGEERSAGEIGTTVRADR